MSINSVSFLAKQAVGLLKGFAITIYSYGFTQVTYRKALKAEQLYYNYL